MSSVTALAPGACTTTSNSITIASAITTDDVIVASAPRRVSTTIAVTAVLRYKYDMILCYRYRGSSSCSIPAIIILFLHDDNMILIIVTAMSSLRAVVTIDSFRW